MMKMTTDPSTANTTTKTDCSLWVDLCLAKILCHLIGWPHVHAMDEVAAALLKFLAAMVVPVSTIVVVPVVGSIEDSTTILQE